MLKLDRVRRKRLIGFLGEPEIAADRAARIEGESVRIAQTYGFPPEFPLADCLIEALVTYFRKKQPREDSLSEHRSRMDSIYESGSLKDAMLLEIIDLTLCGGLKSVEEPNCSRTRNRLRKAVRATEAYYRTQIEERGRHKMGGAPIEEYKATLARTLAVIWFRGTGKLPASGHGKSGFRGAYMKFARDVCEIIPGIEISDRYLHNYMLKIRKDYLEPKHKGL